MWPQILQCDRHADLILAKEIYSKKFNEFSSFAIGSRNPKSETNSKRWNFQNGKKKNSVAEPEILT
jgi:hypothetical protein